MNNARNKTVLAILFFAVIVSGCTGGGGNQDEPASTASVQVNEFSAFPNPTPSGQKTRFRMQLKNVGGSDATQVYVRLFNPPFASGSSDKKTWRSESGGGVQPHQRTLYFGTLSAPSEQTPAVPKTETVTFTAPNLDQGRTISYGMNAYIMYQYNTSATTEIQIMGGDKYRAAGSPSGTASLENSRAPVKMEIRTPTPIVFYDVGNSNTLTRELCVIVRNKGNGVPFAASKSGVVTGGGETGTGYNLDKVQKHENKVLLNIEDIGSVDFEPFGEPNGDKTVKILSGKGVQCWDMQIDIGSSAQIQKTVPLSLRATYGYRKSTKTTVTVEGRR